MKYSDILTGFIPPDYLLKGYNTSYPLFYDSPIFKSNAWFFLEPSFLSQFLGFALVSRLARGRTGWVAAIYVLGIASTVAGTGIVVVVVGVTVLAVQSFNSRIVGRLILLIGGSSAVVAVSPAGSVLAERVTEVGKSDSSASLRFVQPFITIGDDWASSSWSIFLGNGAGASERYVTLVYGSTSLQQPVPLKLLFDYGIVASAVFLAAIVSLVAVSVAPKPLSLALICAFLMLSSSLLQPLTVISMWALTVVFPAASVTRNAGRAPFETRYRPRGVRFPSVALTTKTDLSVNR